MLSNLLYYRLLIHDMVGAVLVGLAFQKGWGMIVLNGDSTRLVYVMIGLFAIFQVSLFIRAGKVTKALNLLKKGAAPPRINAVKFLEKQAHLGDISGWLVTLGLLGTVIGVAIALFGVDAASLSTPEGTKKIITGLIGGMQVALYTTIVGGLLGLWCDINFRVLKTATILMIEDVKEANAPQPYTGS